MALPVNRLVMLGVVLLAVASSLVVVAQPGPQRPAPKKPGGGPPRPDITPNVFNLQILISEKLQEELEITNEQLEQLQSLSEQFRRRSLNLTGSVRENSEELSALRAEFEVEVSMILSEEQFERFLQIQVQQELQKDLLLALSGSGTIATALNITDEQKKEIRAASRAVEDEIRDAIERIREEGNQKMLNVLTPEQKEQLDEMTGEPYEGERGANQRPGGPGAGKGKKGRPTGRPRQPGR